MKPQHSETNVSRCSLQSEAQGLTKKGSKIVARVGSSAQQMLIFPAKTDLVQVKIWVWVNTYRYIFNGMNIRLPAILGFTRYQGFDS